MRAPTCKLPQAQTRTPTIPTHPPTLTHRHTHTYTHTQANDPGLSSRVVCNLASTVPAPLTPNAPVVAILREQGMAMLCGFGLLCSHPRLFFELSVSVSMWVARTTVDKCSESQVRRLCA